MQTAAPRLRPLGIIDQVDAGLQLYRRHFVTFIGIVALVQVPLLVINTLIQVFVSLPAQLRLTETSPFNQEAYWSSFGSYCALMSAVFLAYLLVDLPLVELSSGALARAISQSYLSRPVTLADSYRYMFNPRRLASLVAAALLQAAIYTVCAIVLCIGWVAGIYLFLRFLLTAQVIVLEDQGPLAAMRRSWELTESHALRLFGLVLLGIGVSLLLSLALGSVLNLGIAFGATALNLPQSVRLGLQVLLDGAINVFWIPLSLAVLTLFYYDLRIRKEGYDLELQAQANALGAAPA